MLPISETDTDLIADYAGISRYGIDYTSLVDANQLKQIRNKQKDENNPVLDIRNQTDKLQKKTNLLASVIPDSRRLAYQPKTAPQGLSGFLTKYWRQLVREAHAATTVTKSIGTASRNYSTVTLWEDGEDGNLTSLDEIHKGEGYADSDFSEEVVINLSTTDSTRYMWLTAASGQKHTGTANTGVRQNYTGTTASPIILAIQDSYTIIEDWEWTESSTGNTGNLDVIRIGSGATGSTIRGNLIYNFNSWSGANGSRGVSFNVTTDPATVYNNIFYGLTVAESRAVIMVAVATGTSAIYNNTAYGNDKGFWINAGTGGTVVVENNIGANTVKDFAFGTGAGTFTINYNLSADASADDKGGTGHVISATVGTSCTSGTNVTFISTTGGSENLHLVNCAAGQNDAQDTGTSESGTFTTDIDSDTRPIGAAWDIGADEVPENFWLLTGLAPFLLGILKKFKKQKKQVYNKPVAQ